MRRKNITTLQKCVYCDYFRCTLAQEVTIYVYVLQAFTFIQNHNNSGWYKGPERIHIQSNGRP